LELSITKPVSLKVELYSMNGKMIRNIADKIFYTGKHLLSVQGPDLPAGEYFISVTHGKEKLIRKLIKTTF